jgi:LmbE family N-acetylglucosaminyl deacetylase
MNPPAFRLPFRFLHMSILLGWLVAVVPCIGATSFVLLDRDDRLLVLAPHPDDESIAAGGLIQEAQSLGLPVRVCFFTLGDNNELSFLLTRKHPVLLPGAVRDMGLLRRQEAIAATARLGLAPQDLVFLGYPDFGTLDVWKNHWRDAPPYKSMLTRATAVPYADVLTPGAAHSGEDVLDDLIDVIAEFDPTLVALSHPADHNVDHRALYLFSRVALWDLEPDGPSPRRFAFPVHFTQWPEPRRFHPMRPATPPHFLMDEIDWQEFDLAPVQVSAKHEAVQRHQTQYRYAAAYLDSFVRKSELFGDYADVELPDGIGEYERFEEDASQFRADPSLAEDLFSGSEALALVARQAADEQAETVPHDNDFVRQAFSGDGTRLSLEFEFDKPVGRHARLTVWLYGYRAGTPFGEMPKIRVVAGPRGIDSVHDLATPLPADSAQALVDAPSMLSIEVPYSLLGHPDRILAGARLSFGELPIDWLPWRALDLRGTSPSAATLRESADLPVPPYAEDFAPTAVPPAPDPTSAPPAGRLIPKVPLPRPLGPTSSSEADLPVYW